MTPTCSNTVQPRKCVKQDVCEIPSVSSASVTPWTAAHQAPLSVGVSRQEHWSGWPCPPPGGLPDLGMEPMSLTSPVLAGGFLTTSTTRELPLNMISRTM